MKLRSDVKPVTYLKTHTAEAIDEVGKGRTLVITQHGEAKAVRMVVAEYDRIQETVASLLAVNRGEADVRAGRVTPHAEVMERLRGRLPGAAAASHAGSEPRVAVARRKR